jgi:hypothetical protein
MCHRSKILFALDVRATWECWAEEPGLLGRRLAPQSQPIEIVGLLFARKSIRRQGGRTKLNYLMSLHASSHAISG